jgi:hypothetical protein
VKVKLILPALTEATSPFWRPIKYSLFPPLGLATLADGDDRCVFERTVDWAIEHGIETATFHIFTPYAGTALYRRIAEQGRLTIHDWDLYDTRHAVRSQMP